MVNQDLLTYVKQQLAAGYDTASIRDALAGAGYPIRDVEDAIYEASKPKQKAISPQQMRKPEDILKAHEITGKKAELEEAPKPEREIPPILDLFRMWFLSLSMPRQIFNEAKGYAHFHSALLNVSLAAVLGGLIGGAVFLVKYFLDTSAGYAGTNLFGIGGLFSKLGTIERLFVTPIEAILVWISITAFIHFFSAILGGEGNYERFMYYTSIAYAPTILFVGFLQVLVPPCIVFFSYLAFGVLGIYPTFIAIRDVHKFDTQKAIIALVVPIAIVAVFMLPALLDVANIFDSVCITKVVIPPPDLPPGVVTS